MSISTTNVADPLEQLRAFANQIEALVIELLQNAPVDSRVDPTWAPSRWRQTDPGYKSEPRMEYFWRKPLPNTLNATRSEARQLYNRWHYQASAIIVSSLPQQISRFENISAEVREFIDLEIRSPANTQERDRIIANFTDQFDRQRSILETLIDNPTFKDQGPQHGSV